MRASSRSSSAAARLSSGRLASQRQLLTITERLLLTRDRNQSSTPIADTLAEVVPHDTLTIYMVDRANDCLVPILARDPYADQILATAWRSAGHHRRRHRQGRR